MSAMTLFNGKLKIMLIFLSVSPHDSFGPSLHSGALTALKFKFKFIQMLKRATQGDSVS